MIRRHLPSIAVSLFAAALWVWFLVLLTAPPADAQEQRCSVQTFDPPLASGWAMPGDADTVSILFTDGTGITLAGPFTLGDLISHPGQVALSIEKCSGVGPPVPPDPTPEPPEPTPTTVPTPTPTPPDGTSIVTPGPEPTPTPVVIIPTPPTPPVDPTPTPEVPTATPETPTPDVPMLPETGANTGPLVVAALALLGAGAMALGAARRG